MINLFQSEFGPEQSSVSRLEYALIHLIDLLPEGIDLDTVCEGVDSFIDLYDMLIELLRAVT